MTIWNLVGSDAQNNIVRQALDKCDFPWDDMKASMLKENKSQIRVGWADLGRYVVGEEVAGAHSVVREVEGRRRVLGLFYLPPYTSIVLDTSMVNNSVLGQEVFIAEAAHAADYHSFLPRNLRPLIWNALHLDQYDVAQVSESGDINHGHSYFDGPAGYSTWVGETVMDYFRLAFAPTVPGSIILTHKIPADAVKALREVYFPPKIEPTPVAPAPAPVVTGDYFSVRRSNVFHDVHPGLRVYKRYATYDEARAAGLRPCYVCKPT